MAPKDGESDCKPSQPKGRCGAGVADLAPGKATPGLGTAPGERTQGVQGSCSTRPHRMPNYLSRIPHAVQANASASSEVTVEVILCTHCLPAMRPIPHKRPAGIQMVTKVRASAGPDVQGRKRQLETRRNPAT